MCKYTKKYCSDIETRMKTKHYKQLVSELVNYANALEQALADKKES